jgi:hypothetical protein
LDYIAKRFGDAAVSSTVTWSALCDVLHPAFSDDERCHLSIELPGFFQDHFFVDTMQSVATRLQPLEVQALPITHCVSCSLLTALAGAMLAEVAKIPSWLRSHLSRRFHFFRLGFHAFLVSGKVKRSFTLNSKHIVY